MKKRIFKKRPGEGTPFTVAIVLVLLILFCAIAEYGRVWIIAHGVQEATQRAIISTVNDNYDDIYHAARESYAAGWLPDRGSWAESLDEGNVYGQLSSTLGLSPEGRGFVKYSEGQVEFILSGLSVELQNNGLSSGVSEGYTGIGELHVEIPIRFLGNIFPSAQIDLHVEAKYVPLF